LGHVSVSFPGLHVVALQESKKNKKLNGFFSNNTLILRCVGSD